MLDSDVDSPSTATPDSTPVALQQAMVENRPPSFCSWFFPSIIKRPLSLVFLVLLLVPSLLRSGLPAVAGFSSSSFVGATPTMSDPDASSNSNNNIPILYDLPVSNNGARCRIILYKKKLIDQGFVEIRSPLELGGLKSPDYLALNPQGKMPLLVLPSTTGDGKDNSNPLTALPESDTIARYLLSTYSSEGPCFQIDDARSNLMARIHDMYITTIQGCLYKATPPFGTFGSRHEAIAELDRQWRVIQDLMVANDGMYLCGKQVSLADATIFPTCVFMDHIRPKFGGTPLPPRLAHWYATLSQQDPDFARVRTEITTALQSWDAKGRWDTILGAGWRDTAPATLFDKIIAGEIPASLIEPQPDPEHLLAFRDIHPAAPAHVLIVPKERQGLTRLTQASEEHREVLGRLLVSTTESRG